MLNTAIKGVVIDNAIIKPVDFVLPVPQLSVLVLLLSILLSALALIYVKDLGRCLYIQYGDLQQTAQRLTVDRDRLMLEESAWANSIRVQEIAKQQLGMKFPETKDVVLLEF